MPAQISRLRGKYRDDVVPALMKRFGYKNPMAVPKISKVVVNIGLGEASQNVKLLDVAAIELGQIAGQRPIITRAKKSIANFKIRKGMPIGCCVTLRGDRMYEFLDRLCNVVLPRVRDFKGLPANAFDGRGNYTMGLRDQLVFPEIDYTRVDKIKGMNITLTTTARNDEEGRELLENDWRAFAHAGLKEIYGANLPSREDEQEAEIFKSPAQPLPHLRAPARLHPQVRDVPHLFPRPRAARRDSRRAEGELVTGHANRSHCRHADAHSQRHAGAARPGGIARVQAED